MASTPVWTRTRQNTLAIQTILVLAGAALLGAPRLARPASLTGPELVQRLQAGGYVIVMRHARAPGTLPDAARARPDNPRRERQLDEAGEAAARALGAALRSLRIPIGPIYSSPTYRARETIRLTGLGMPRLIEELAENEHGMSGAAERPQIDWLRQAVVRPPPSGSNTLIVTHTPNIAGAFGREAAGLEAGEMLVFEPNHAARPRLLGRITVEEWQALARQLASSRR